MTEAVLGVLTIAMVVVALVGWRRCWGLERVAALARDGAVEVGKTAATEIQRTWEALHAVEREREIAQALATEYTQKWLTATEAEAARARAIDAAQQVIQARQTQRTADNEHYESFLFDVVRAACGTVGLNMANVSNHFDLSTTGRLNDVLHYAAQSLTEAHPLRTVGDVVAFLARRD